MSVLSEQDIVKGLGRNIIILPFESKAHNLKGCDIRLTASEYAYFFDDTPASLSHKRCEVKDGSFILPAHKTTIVWTQEFIHIDNSLCGSLHSKVDLASKGIGHIGTRVYPNWGGILAIALHNLSPSDIHIRVGDTMCYLRLHRLTSKTSQDFRPDKGGKMEDVFSDRSVYPQELKQWLSERQKGWDANSSKIFCKKHRNDQPYQEARKEYESLIKNLDITRWSSNVWNAIMTIATISATIISAVALFISTASKEPPTKSETTNSPNNQKTNK